MSTTRNISQTELICGLKAAITGLECLHNAQLLKQKEKVQSKETPPKIYIAIPIQDITRVGKEKSRRKKPKCDKGVPLKRIDSSSTRIRSTDEKKAYQCKKTSRAIFPEMRGGILYSKCWCLHRNGLQDHCPLSQCQGQSECLVRPWAVCPPGKMVRSRYPDLYPQ